MADAKDRHFVNALARGLQILRAYRTGDVALGNQELAERTGLPKPTVSRLTRTLRELDFLASDPRTGTYALGAGALSLGGAALSGLTPGGGVDEQLKRLAEETGLVSVLATRDGAEVTLLQVYPGGGPVSVNALVGETLPLHLSAIGLAILGAAPDRRRRTMLSELRAMMPRKEFGALDREVKRTAQDYANAGFCLVRDGWRPGCTSVAAALEPDESGREFGISLGAPTPLTTEQDWTETYGPMVAEAARALRDYRAVAAARA